LRLERSIEIYGEKKKMSWVSSERWEEWEGEWGREQGN